MGNRISELRVQHCHFIPKELEEGILYVSLEYKTAIHLCACGCGLQTVTPINPPYGWVYIETNRLPTLSPSIGNFRYPCKSHYFVRNGTIDWCSDSGKR